MANQDQAPDWNLLPHRPEAFFVLSGEYDRKDLKRAYNRLLKQYKPEKFPQEFQLIRAAFEELDNQLRYGRRLNGPSFNLSHLNWQAETIPAPVGAGASSANETPSVQGIPVQRFWERLEKESPQDLFSELKSKQGKSAFDYYALAILGDTLTNRDEMTFVKWILKGLGEHPHDPALFRLLYQYLRLNASHEQSRGLVKAVAKVIHDDRFYMLTEPLWDRLLLAGEFQELGQFLEACERQLQDHQVNGRVAFYLHFTRKAMFQATRHWLDRAFALIDANHEVLHGQSEVELEVLQALYRYRCSREEFLDGNELFAALDRVILEYCEQEDFQAEKSFLDLQVQIASGEWDVLEAFPVEHDHAIEAFFESWLWIDADIAARFGIEETELGENLQRRSLSVLNLMQTMATRTRKSWRGRLWLSLGWIYEVTRYALGILFVVLLFLGYYVLLFPLESTPAALGVIPLVIIGILGGRWAGKKWILPCYQAKYISLADVVYDLVWRDELERYVRQTALSLPLILKLIRATSEENDRFSESIVRVGHEDIGLGCLAIAMKYLS